MLDHVPDHMLDHVPDHVSDHIIIGLVAIALQKQIKLITKSFFKEEKRLLSRQTLLSYSAPHILKSAAFYLTTH